MEASYGAAGRAPGAQTLHQLTQPVIHVAPDRRSASVRTRLFRVDAHAEGEDVYAAGAYELTLTREDGVWRIASMVLDHTWAAPYSEGWAGVTPGFMWRDVADPEAVAADAAPDCPPTGSGAPPFPEVAELRMHYDNPVTGRGGAPSEPVCR
jgi:hypothetical protein